MSLGRLQFLELIGKHSELIGNWIIELLRTRGMGFVSTNVNGIPEMLTNHDGTHLIAAGDPFKLVDALKKALDGVFKGSTKMTSMVYARASRDFRKDRSLPRQLAETREAYLSYTGRPQSVAGSDSPK